MYISEDITVCRAAGDLHNDAGEIIIILCLQQKDLINGL